MGAGNPDAFKRQSEEIRSVFGDLPIVEAKADLLLFVGADEHQEGVRGDPAQCMFAMACKRAFGSTAVLFYPTVAYADMLEPGTQHRVVMRFKLPRQTREQLEAFDRDNIKPPWEATFLLKAVPKGATREYMAKMARERAKRRAALDDDPQRKQRRAAAKKGHQTRLKKELMGVRSGRGQVYRQERTT